MTSDRRDWLLFGGWFLTGACYLLALLSILSIGIFLLPIVVIGTVALATRPGTQRGLLGLLSSASLPLMLLAYLNRRGPGTYCTTSATGGDCTEGLLNPWILGGVSLLVLAAGVTLFLKLRRRPVASPAPE